MYNTVLVFIMYLLCILYCLTLRTTTARPILISQVFVRPILTPLTVQQTAALRVLVQLTSALDKRRKQYHIESVEDEPCLTH